MVLRLCWSWVMAVALCAAPLALSQHCEGFSPRPNDTVVAERGMACLYCDYPNVDDIVWLRGSTSIETGMDSTVCNCEARGGHPISLCFDSVQREDADRYTCRATVGFGDVRDCSARLILAAVDCGSLTDPANGQVNQTAGTTLGQTATYSCDTHYNLVGDSIRTCQATGNWSGSAPTCQAPPGQVDNATVRSENLSLRRTQLTWYAPASNNAPIINYWITYCISIMDSINDTCVRSTTIPIFDSSEKPMVDLTDINPERRYRVTIWAENAAGMGPESPPYFFDSATADDAKPVHLSAVFVSETGVVLSWQLPNIANQSDVVIYSYSINYTRMASRVFMTRSSQTSAIAISGLESNQTYVFRVSAIYSLPFLQSIEQSLTLTTQRYVPLTNPTVPITMSDSITVSWPAPPGAVVLENYILEYTIGQISGRRKRQTGSFNITIPASQTSYTLRDNVRPFTRYTFQVFANFGDGLVVLIVAPFSTQTGEAPTECTSGNVRLAGDATELEGRVEVCFNNSWGTVCDDLWDDRDARVVCRQLGLPSAGAESRRFGPGRGRIFLDDVSCTGVESRLTECSSLGIGVHNCSHSQDAGVVCAGLAIVGFTRQSYIVSEGDQLRICVEVSEGELEQESIFILRPSINGNTTTGNYFGNFSGQNVTFPPGSSAGDEVCVSTLIYSDSALETSETTVNVEVFPRQFGVAFVPVERRLARVTIVDTNVVMVGFVHSTYSVSEASSEVQVCVQVSGAPFGTTELERPVLARISSQGKTATAGQDYREVIPRIVHFPGEAPHTSLQCITINILDDEEFEGEIPESFSLNLSVQDIAVVVSTSSATVFITDDEGIATPEPPTITTGTPPVVTTPPPFGPLEVHLANNTPHVVENTVTLQVHTNKPASATCRLGRVATMPCPPGRTTMFQNVPSGWYSLLVTATSDMEEAKVLWKVYVPMTSSTCSVNLINAGLVVDGTTVSMEFRGVGSTSSFTCRLDNRQFSSCTSPLSYSGLTPGQHRIRILAQGCLQIQGQTFRFTV